MKTPTPESKSTLRSYRVVTLPEPIKNEHSAGVESGPRLKPSTLREPAASELENAPPVSAQESTAASIPMRDVAARTKKRMPPRPAPLQSMAINLLLRSSHSARTARARA